jgi:predicted secreted Zn-dependent protease
LRLLICAVSAAPAVGLAGGGVVTTTTTVHDHRVAGVTASALVRSLNGHPLQGDHGAAYASIRPDYQLSLTTLQRANQCVVQSVGVHVDFDLTLPVADSLGQMSGRTRAAWNSFAAFARSHEEHHKASYLGCAREFIAQAKLQKADACIALESRIRTMLSQMQRSCEIRQLQYDQSQRRALSRMSLFVMAQYQRRARPNQPVSTPHRVLARSSAGLCSTQCSPAGPVSFFQKGASVFR